MSRSAFLLSLQDLVFGLFGALAMLVVVFSIFSDGEHSLESRFVLVKVQWDDRGLSTVTNFAGELATVALYYETRQIDWVMQPTPLTLGDAVAEGRGISTIFYVNEEALAEIEPRQSLKLRLPTTANSTLIRTRGGEFTVSNATECIIDID